MEKISKNQNLLTKSEKFQLFCVLIFDKKFRSKANLLVVVHPCTNDVKLDILNYLARFQPVSW